MSCVTLGGNYKGCISSLKEASLDDSDQNNKHYMTKSNLSVYDFDKVKAQYSTALGMSTRPKSVDALSSSTNGDIYLIEFKNGNLSDKVKKLEIRQKIYDSLIMLYDCWVLTLFGRGMKSYLFWSTISARIILGSK